MCCSHVVPVAVLCLAGSLTGCGDRTGLMQAAQTSRQTGAADAAVALDAAVPSPVDGGQAACHPGTWVLLDAVRNARDLGGTPLQGGGTVACGALYRSAAPVGLSAKACSDFLQLGVRTVVDLRTPAERTASPTAVCVTDSTSLVTAPMPIPYAVSPADYIADMNATESVRAFFGLLADDSAYPIDVHCVYGRDRTGVMAAIVLLALGASRDVVAVEYDLTADAGMATYPASLAAVLDAIAQHGGIEAYLAGAGVAPETLTRARARLIVPPP